MDNLTVSPLVFDIIPERPCDAAPIEALLDVAFGPGRFAKTAYRLREGVPPLRDLSLVALHEGRLIGSVRFSPIRVGGTPALLLGPLAVDPHVKGRGAGKALVRHGLAGAAAAGHCLVLLVGDYGYYGPLGFAHVPPGALVFPGPVNPDRVLVAALAAGAAEGLSGKVEPGGT